MLPLTLLLAALLLSSAARAAETMQIHSLTIEHLLHADLRVVNGYPIFGHDKGPARQPLIPTHTPVFGWQLSSTAPGAAQTAYRIILSENAAPLTTAPLWDTGKIPSADAINIPYTGAPLQPDTRYHWQVMAWDTDDRPSPWSPVASFLTAPQLTDYQTAHYPLLKTDEAPQSITDTSGILRLDFGKAAFGQLKLTLTAPDSPTTVTIRLGEAIQPDGRINRNPGGTIRYAAYPLALRPGRHTYSLQFKPDKRNTGPTAIKMPADIGEVYPFRYCEIEGYPHPLAPTDVIRASVHYPFNDSAAHFESSDPTLNAIWELSKYSIKATSFAGLYIDGDRERIPYEADAYINQLCHYAVDNEYTMARRTHEYLIHHATWPTEWILQSVLMAHNNYLYTGDLRSARHHYDDLKAKLLLPLRDSNGLISTTTGKQTPEVLKSIHFNGKALRDIVDWPHTGAFGMDGLGETDGFVFTDYNTVVNAFHYKALTAMAQLATALGHPADAATFAAHARQTHAAFQTHLWNPEKAAYQDGLSTTHTSLHSNMMALAFGLVPDAHRPAVARHIRTRGMACSVYGSQFLLDALYDAGEADYALQLLTSKSDRSWYNMIRAGSTITMEAWDNKYKPNQDWNHAWGAVPANIIPRKLMGIQPLEPGWKEFQIKPQPASLQWAKIKVPTIRGPIHLDYHKTTQTQTYTLTIPPNTKAHLTLPSTETGKAKTAKAEKVPEKITLNGKTTTPKNKTLTLPPGTHKVQVAW